MGPAALRPLGDEGAAGGAVGGPAAPVPGQVEEVHRRRGCPHRVEGGQGPGRRAAR